MSDQGFGIKEYLDAKFAAVDQRFDSQDARLDIIERAGPRAGAFGAAGTFLGALVVFVLSAFGVKPGQQ